MATPRPASLRSRHVIKRGGFQAMLRFKPSLLRITLMLLTMAQTCSAAWKAGDALPDLNSFKIEGKLPDKLKGQVIVLDFWASWCGPCKRSFPAMQELYDQFAKQGVVIIAVSVDEGARICSAFSKACMY